VVAFLLIVAVLTSRCISSNMEEPQLAALAGNTNREGVSAFDLDLVQAGCCIGLAEQPLA